MFVGFRILVGSSAHNLYSSMFVLATEVMPEPIRAINGAVFNSGIALDIYYPPTWLLVSPLVRHVTNDIDFMKEKKKS